MECEKRVVPINKEQAEEQKRNDPFIAYREQRLNENMEKLKISNEEKEQRKELIKKFDLHL